MSDILIPAKYFDRKLSRPLDINMGGCDLNDWKEQCGRYAFAMHPKGFPIFIPPHELIKFDEYKQSDPYFVELNSNFHQHRLRYTLAMIQDATKNAGGGGQKKYLIWAVVKDT